jgi:hypothetical protein
LVKEGIKLDYRFHLTDRQIELPGDFTDSFMGDMQKLLLHFVQHM